MNLALPRLLDILGVEHAAAVEKRVPGRFVIGASGHAALGVLKLLNIVQELTDASSAANAAEFDSFKWLGQWIEHPVPALGGRKPAALIDTPTGVMLVAKVLEASRSGAYL